MMNWQYLGKIFDPTEHKLLDGCTTFAQSPQAIVFDDFIRIYFSTRSKDGNNYASHIGYVDFNRTLNTILNVSTHVVVPLGELGTFDEHGIFPINPLKVDNKIVAYSCGWSRRISVSVETSVGYLESNDNGNTFTRIGLGPILSSSVKEPVLVGDAFVQKYNDLYHMWYIFGKPWLPANGTEPPSRVYKIAHATSSDGINWSKEEGVEIIKSVLNEDECQALPSVIEHNGIYHMVFCFRHNTDFRQNKKRGYRLGYAYSKDLINWERNDALLNFNTFNSTWDSDMQCYPHFFKVQDDVFLLYNGNEFGKYGFGAAKLIF